MPSFFLTVPLARCRWRRTAGRLVRPDPSCSSSLACETSLFILSKRGPVSRGHTPPASVASSPPSPEMTVGTRLLRNSMFALWHFHSRRLCRRTVTVLPPTITSEESGRLWPDRRPQNGSSTQGKPQLIKLGVHHRFLFVVSVKTRSVYIHTSTQTKWRWYLIVMQKLSTVDPRWGTSEHL